MPENILLIEEGDTIAADARVIHSVALQTAEAALTGESLPVAKESEAALAEDAALGDRRNMVFSGTAAYGRGRAGVTATGMRTEMGRIAGMLGETQSVLRCRRSSRVSAACSASWSSRSRSS